MKPTTIKEVLEKFGKRIESDFCKVDSGLGRKHTIQAVAQIKSILKSVVGENKEVNIIPLKQGDVIVGFFERDDKREDMGYNQRGDEINKRIEGEI